MDTHNRRIEWEREVGYSACLDESIQVFIKKGNSGDK